MPLHLACVAAYAFAASPWPADTVWTDARTLGIQGRGFAESELPDPYSRLPTAAKAGPDKVSTRTWILSRTAVGMWVDIDTDSTSVFVRFNFTESVEGGDWLWPINGHSGVDMYARDPSLTGTATWRWATSSGNGCQHMAKTWTAHELSFSACLTGMPPVARDGNGSVTGSSGRQVRVYLPARSQLDTVEIGVLSGATIAPVPPVNLKPVVWYGTSIVHGAAALHAGMVWSNQANKMLADSRPGVNMGFSG
jgi:hypothetical protein